jgi:uncharacterized repeat protein (TIGR03803 family)
MKSVRPLFILAALIAGLPYMEQKTTLVRRMAAGSAFLLLLVTGVWAQSYSVLTSFNGTDGSQPAASPIIDNSGNVFGTTGLGGASNYGVVYELVNNGGGSYTNTTLHSFAGGTTDGCYSYGGLLMDPSGNLYGVAAGCGAYNAGVIYELAKSGGTYMESVIHTFRGGPDGATPVGSLVMDAKGNLYGTTDQGAGGNCYAGCGTVFQLMHRSDTWTKKVLHSFKNNGVDGWYPEAGVTLDSKDNIYGTTSRGGSYQEGAVFRLSPPTKTRKSYQETIIHTFYGGIDGCAPSSGVLFDSSSNLVGATGGCGQYNYGTVYQLMPAGKTYRIDVILQFNGTNGAPPCDWAGDAAIDSSGNVYGVAYGGGAYGAGTVFKLASGSFAYTDLHDFDTNGTDGYLPYGGVSLDSSGSLYGATKVGGLSTNYGTVWQITSP